METTAICTSYFAARPPRERIVVIAKSYPRYMGAGLVIARQFAPFNPRAPAWQRAYAQDLHARFPEPRSLLEYIKQIQDIIQNPILCCYEADPQNCHRSILGTYIEHFCSIPCPEWDRKTI